MVDEARGMVKGAVEPVITVEAFEYPACPGVPPTEWKGWEEAGGGVSAPHHARSSKDGSDGAAVDERLAEETKRSFEAGRERGRLEGCQADREAQAAGAKREEERRKRELARLIEEFAEGRDRFLMSVEHEVVKLALAVAARILRREAQMDPLLLTGAVRVALGQLAAASEVQLRVPAAQVEMWTEAVALIPHLKMKPLVIADEEMRLGDCAVESKVGTVDLGVRSQLGEIERGFFDRAGESDRKSSVRPSTAEMEA
jgi:flagellar assembly protein FliH